MENLIKGWVLSTIGFITFIGVIIHATGVYTFPNPEFINEGWEIGIALTASFILAVSPKTKLDAYGDKLADGLFGIFKKKTE